METVFEFVYLGHFRNEFSLSHQIIPTANHVHIQKQCALRFQSSV